MGVFETFHRAKMGASLGNAAATARIGVQRAENAQDRVADLEERVDKLSLLNLALWELLKEKTGLTEAELCQRVEEIDLQDGQLDGRAFGGVINCPDCSQPLSRRHRRCLYCDYELPREGFGAAIR